MNGLIIKEKWLNLILSGSKVWEIRSSNTNIRGRILLIKSGSKKIFGECNIIDSKKLSLLDYQNNMDKHCIEDGLNVLPYKNTYAWVISNTKKYKDPMPYKHHNGAVIWVKID